MFEYKMVQIPPTILAKSKDESTMAASYLQTTVSQNAVDGWEFYRVDSIGVAVPPGCLPSLFGNKTTTKSYYVVTFRKNKEC